MEIPAMEYSECECGRVPSDRELAMRLRDADPSVSKDFLIEWIETRYLTDEMVQALSDALDHAENDEARRELEALGIV
jgi:hypothetical protein